MKFPDPLISRCSEKKQSLSSGDPTESSHSKAPADVKSDIPLLVIRPPTPPQTGYRVADLEVGISGSNMILRAPKPTRERRDSSHSICSPLAEGHLQIPPRLETARKRKQALNMKRKAYFEKRKQLAKYDIEADSDYDEAFLQPQVVFRRMRLQEAIP